MKSLFALLLMVLSVSSYAQITFTAGAGAQVNVSPKIDYSTTVVHTVVSNDYLVVSSPYVTHVISRNSDDGFGKVIPIETFEFNKTTFGTSPSSYLKNPLRNSYTRTQNSIQMLRDLRSPPELGGT